MALKSYLRVRENENIKRRRVHSNGKKERLNDFTLKKNGTTIRRDIMSITALYRNDSFRPVKSIVRRNGGPRRSA